MLRSTSFVLRRLRDLLAVWAPLSAVVACSGSEVTPGGSGGGGAGGSAGMAGSAQSTSGTGSSPGGTSGTGGGGGSAGAAGAPAGGSAGAAGGVGGGGTAGAGGGGTAGQAAVEPTFATVQRVVQTSCFGAPCHDEPGNPLQMKPLENLVTTLKGHTTQDCGPTLTPGSPENSAFVKLLKAECGGTSRMPLGKCFDDGDPGCVAPEDIAAIEKWIQNGAMP